MLAAKIQEIEGILKKADRTDLLINTIFELGKKVVEDSRTNSKEKVKILHLIRDSLHPDTKIALSSKLLINLKLQKESFNFVSLSSLLSDQDRTSLGKYFQKLYF